jgi:hypothetical protein
VVGGVEPGIAGAGTTCPWREVDDLDGPCKGPIPSRAQESAKIWPKISSYEAAI